MENLMQNRLKKLLDYNPKTGVFRWKISRRGNCKFGDVAGTINSNGYRVIGIDSKRYYASRLAWLFMEGYLPEYEIDHENRVEDDNKWKNIRHVSRQCNLRNRGRQRNNTSGVTGVFWAKPKKKWRAQIAISDKMKHLGYFKVFKDAVLARWQAEVDNNWPGCNDHTDAFIYLNNEKQI